ncbi:FKBP-type peptidyl-prolyl cis-trans isomerase N-terminal domain-containing protein [Erwinia sorbitola]|uniref:Peptidyl-prolyl cis-trans isomerase FKBP-type N-terminal domain-containing protein n=1 Tax=Erwinia sorbitola TaxID=2681984 RepID=A0A6I6ED67_9GAMM|nr:FKBP-type peptidyl-prolyl cis-trans isomerase N-terminal domain-containing protein [Erwinia sorbitola]QGU85735.1 hypothetical protein GN242_00210 [Erwinia sorbitola]
MIGKYPAPFALSAAALVVMTCLGAMHSKVYAAELEAPAVLQFATSYQEQQHKTPQAPLAPPVQERLTPPRVTSEAVNTVTPPRRRVQAAPAPAPRVDRTQLKALRRDIADKDREISQKAKTIRSLEEQIAVLQQSPPVAPVVEETSQLSQADKQAMLDMAQNLRQIFSLHPTHNTLVEKLTQAKDQLKEVQLAETALRGQLKALNEGKEHVLSAHEAALNQQIEEYNKKIAELETNLSTSRDDIQKITAERDEIKSKEQKLAADSAQEKEKLTKEKQQLLEQIAQSQEGASGQDEASKQQQLALEKKLSEAEQTKNKLQTEAEQLKTELAARPTAEQLAESELIAKSLMAKVDLLQLSQKAPVDTAATATDKPGTPPAENDKELQAKLDAALVELAEAKKQKADVKASPELPHVTPEQLNKKSAREGYAIGMSLGDEILQMQAENNSWGKDAEKNIVLAGIVDAFQGKPKLSVDALEKTLTEVSHRETQEQKKLISNLDQATKQYLQKFTKMKNTKKSPSGFWYNITYEGDTPIAENATYNVVVKESLTNGEVITDMDARGTMLTQPLSGFPPVFREALKKLKNHGSITIVVPRQSWHIRISVHRRKSRRMPR